jgi:hypothetical protein
VLRANPVSYLAVLLASSMRSFEDLSSSAAGMDAGEKLLSTHPEPKRGHLNGFTVLRSTSRRGTWKCVWGFLTTREPQVCRETGSRHDLMDERCVGLPLSTHASAASAADRSLEHSILLHWFTQEAWTLGSRYNIRPHPSESRNILLCRNRGKQY